MRFEIKPQDIQKFLAKHGYVWNGELDTWGGHRKANSKDFESVGMVNYMNVSVDNKQVALMCTVSPIEFITLKQAAAWYDENAQVDKNLSSEWQTYLFLTYRDEYISYLQESSEEAKNEIEKEYKVREIEAIKKLEAEKTRKLQQCNKHEKIAERLFKEENFDLTLDI